MLVTVFASCQEFAGKQTLRSAWELGGCLPASHGGVAQRSWSCWSNQSQGQVAPRKLTLVLHPVTLHPALVRWVSYLKNMAWPKEDLEVLTVSSELAFEDTETKVNILPCVAPAACWEDGWRAEEGLKNEQCYPLVCMRLERWGKGEGEKRTPEWN